MSTLLPHPLVFRDVGLYVTKDLGGVAPYVAAASPPPLDNFVTSHWYSQSAGFFQDSTLLTPANVGDPIGGWVDQISGDTVKQLVGTKRPILQAGNVPVLFDGLDDYLDTLVSTFTTAQPYILACNFRLTGTPAATTRLIIGKTAGSQSYISVLVTTAIVQISAGTGRNAGAVVDTAPHGAVGGYAGANSRILLDGSTSGAGNAGTNGFGLGFTLGASPTGTTNFLGGALGDVVIYTGSADPTAAQLKSVSDWLRGRGGY